jgi:hypothetical protein
MSLPILKDWSVQQIEKYLSEALDANKTFITCEEHGYTPGKFQKPKFGCSNCARADFLTAFAKTPPHKRGEFVERLSELVRTLVENKDKLGEIALERPRLTIEKDAH